MPIQPLISELPEEEKFIEWDKVRQTWQMQKKKQRAMDCHMFLTQKRNGDAKGQTAANGSTQ